MRRTVAGSSLVLALVLSGAAACSDDDGDRTPSQADLDRIDLSPDVFMEVSESGFEPESLEVTAGDVLEIENTGDEPHTFTDDTGEIDITLLAGEHATVVLEEVGDMEIRDRTTTGPRGDERTAAITVTPRPDAQ